MSNPTPRIVSCRPLHICGILQRITAGIYPDILDLISRFDRSETSFLHAACPEFYGVVFNDTASISYDYLFGMESNQTDRQSADLCSIELPSSRYAAFSHRGHISSIGETLRVLRSAWRTTEWGQVADAPFFERYDEDFDRRTGHGGFEIWIPVHPIRSGGHI